MNSSPSSNPPPPPPPSTSSGADGSDKKVRKPYTITKSRESWTDEEHDKFLEALQLFDRDWKKIEDFVGSKTVIQIRSHAQKYFLKVQKNGTTAHVPPPRPKRKAAHPYPHKASKNDVAYLASSNILQSGYASWDEAPFSVNNRTIKFIPREDDLASLLGAEADIGSKGVTRNSNNGVSGTGSRTSSEIQKQGKQTPALHAIPDFAEVYTFLGSVFDPATKGHEQKLKEMDPINFETMLPKIKVKLTRYRPAKLVLDGYWLMSINNINQGLSDPVLMMMRNLSVNLLSPHYEPFRKVLSSYDVQTNSLGLAAGTIPKNHTSELPC